MFKNGTSTRALYAYFNVKAARMTDPAPARPTRFRTGGLSPRKPTRFFWSPSPEERAALADELQLLAVLKLEFSGQIDPAGRDEFRLQGQLTAYVDQACIVTLAPVRAEISESVLRRYVAGLELPDADEIEIPEDDSVEPMPETLDIPEIAAEVLMLALPLYPRAAGAEFGALTHAPKGASEIDEAPQKPFAGLAALADRLKSGSDNGGTGAA